MGTPVNDPDTFIWMLSGDLSGSHSRKPNKPFFGETRSFPNIEEKHIYRSVHTLQTMRERKTFIRKIKQGGSVRYAEVWNERRGKKVIQHHVRYLGSDPENPGGPSSFDIGNAQFEFLAQRILNGNLAVDDLDHMLKDGGKTAGRKNIREVVIRYNLDEGRLRLHLVFPRNAGKGGENGP